MRGMDNKRGTSKSVTGLQGALRGVLHIRYNLYNLVRGLITVICNGCDGLPQKVGMSKKRENATTTSLFLGNPLHRYT